MSNWHYKFDLYYENIILAKLYHPTKLDIRTLKHPYVMKKEIEESVRRPRMKVDYQLDMISLSRYQLPRLLLGYI